MKKKIDKEPEEVRKERIRLAKSMMTKAIKNPKVYVRNKKKIEER